MSGFLPREGWPGMKVWVNHKITVPGNSLGYSGAQCHLLLQGKLRTAIPTGGGLHLYSQATPLSYELAFINFACGTPTTYSFDVDIETKQGTQYTSQQHWEGEVCEIDFFNAKKFTIKN